MSTELDGRKLADMRVVDLRAELEKRGLDKSGNKQILLERLQKVLDEESGGENNQGTKMETKSIIEKTDAPSNGENPDEEMDAEDNTEENEQKDKEASDLQKINTEDKKAKEQDKSEDDPPTKKPSSEDADTKKSTNPEDSSSEIKEEAAAPEEASEENNEANGDGDQDDEMEEKSSKDVSEENPVDEEKSTNEGNTDDNIEEPAAQDSNQQTDNAENSTEKTEKQKETREDSKKKEGSKDPETKTNSSEKSQAGKAPAASKSAAKERFLNEQNRNLWITNISQNTRATELKQALSEHGKVIGAKVVINARHPAACCYGYVKMETAADADNCIAKLNNTELNGHIIRIEKVRPDHLSPLKHKLETSQREKLHLKHHSGSTSVKKDDERKDEKDKDSGSTKDKETSQREGKDDKKTEKSGEKKDASSKDDKKTDSKRHVYRSKSRDMKSKEKHHRSASRGRAERSLSNKSGNRGREREREMLTFDKIKDEREREKLRERERILRDRRREEAARQREMERRQRSESVRLEREREKLKRERERLEREKAEFMQFERERQKLEREKLELERIELERAKMRMQEEERRAVKRPAPSSSSNYRERERSYEDRKRITGDRHFDEAPPPPRFDPPSRDGFSLKGRDSSPPIKKFSTSNSSSKDYKSRLGYDKREPFPQKRDYEDRTHPPSISRGAAPIANKYDGGSSSYSSSRDRGDMRDPRVRESGTLSSTVSNTKYTASSDSKVGRYNERDRSPHFRSVRDERDRRPITDSKTDIRPPRSDHRYPEQQKDSVRYERTSSSSNWTPQKVFGASTSAPANKQWGKESWRTDTPPTTDRWNATNPPRGGATGLTSSTFSNNTGINMGPSCPPPPGINNYVNDRFDYKANMANIRKY